MQPDISQITDSLKVDQTGLYSVTVYTVAYLLSLLSTMAFNNLVKSLIMSQAYWVLFIDNMPSLIAMPSMPSQ